MACIVHSREEFSSPSVMMTVMILSKPSVVVRQNEIVSSHEVKSRANLSRPVVVAAQWVNQHEIMLGFEAVQESILT